MWSPFEAEASESTYHRWHFQGYRQIGKRIGAAILESVQPFIDRLPTDTEHTCDFCNRYAGCSSLDN
jgi:hypothetical protein